MTTWERTLLERQTVGGTVVRPWAMSSRLASLAWNEDRMHNMTLAVGPGTPASIIYVNNLRNRAMEEDSEDDDDVVNFTWARNANSSDDEDDDDYNEEDPMDVDEAAFEQAEEEVNRGSANEREHDDEDDEEEENEEGPSPREPELADTRASARQRQDSSSSDNNSNNNQTNINLNKNLQFPYQWKPELRHAGCINTACWMTVPWRLAAPLSGAVSQNSNECTTIIEGDFGQAPTQLITAGDDRMVKLWDARYAMGTANPLDGGWDTFTPLSTTNRPFGGFQNGVKREYIQKPQSSIAGSVIPLSTVCSGHRGNVFHVTPLNEQPGKLLTCAADGYLRLVDLQAQSSSVVINPLSYDEPTFFLGSNLAFSHTMLSAQTGLLCSDRGLHLFDLRLSPREQSRHSLLADPSDNASTTSSSDSGSSSGACKACAVWRPSGAETESHYVFAGSSSPFVNLYDLRADGSRRDAVEFYRPRFVRSSADVSVSGLDVSKDGKELLVSYESDQIYTFPIMGHCPNTPSIDDIEKSAEECHKRGPVRDSMTFGCHLNRFTFLKNARYAGPNDEYVCSGSDSGHAWIWKRDTGTVSSLMCADMSTCNGVIPHPTLPFFITYGIDPTARIWRATTPVDSQVDDSPDGRALCRQEERFEISPVVQSPRVVQMLLLRYNEKTSVLPDFIASRSEISGGGKFSSPNRRGMVDYESPRIGNAYRSLPSILRSNRYECYRGARCDMSGPIDSMGLIPFSVRVSLCRLQHQASRLGVSFSLYQPWNFQNTGNVHPADLVPDHPSDWLLLDERMTTVPFQVHKYHFNVEDWSEFLLQKPEMKKLEQATLFSVLDDTPVWLKSFESSAKDDFSWPTRNVEDKDQEEKSDANDSDDEDDDAEEEVEDEVSLLPFSATAKKRAQMYLYYTALLLKEGGNMALKDGLQDTAARRYDKAIQYCSIAFMNYCEGKQKLAHLKENLTISMGSEQPVVVWSPLLKLLITSRLNMALLLLRPRFAAVSDAITQAVEALRLLSPFAARSGAVVVMDESGEEEFVWAPEPAETFQQARSLQAKAYFRLGSAKMEKGDWSAAVDAFQASIHCSEKPDSLVRRRLQEAKNKKSSQKKRDRRRFEVALSEDAEQGESKRSQESSD